MSSRVELVHVRAELLGRDERYRGGFAAVISRSFGPPAITAECGAPLLEVGGRLIVSEPPGQASTGDANALPAAERWPAEECEKLGLSPELGIREAFGFAILRQVSPCSDRYPRRPGIPAKRPLFTSGVSAKPMAR